MSLSHSIRTEVRDLPGIERRRIAVRAQRASAQEQTVDPFGGRHKWLFHLACRLQLANLRACIDNEGTDNTVESRTCERLVNQETVATCGECFAGLLEARRPGLVLTRYTRDD